MPRYSATKSRNRKRRFRPGWTIALVLACFLLVYSTWAFDHSAVERQAILWHHRHGDHIIANGVMFPVYYWHVPKKQDDYGFVIQDFPGPLRPGDDRVAIIEVNRPGADSATTGLTPAQMVEMKAEEYRQSHYAAIATMSLTVAGEPVECLRSDELVTTLYCYGEGRVVRLFFVGGKAQLEHFKAMIAGAERL